MEWICISCEIFLLLHLINPQHRKMIQANSKIQLYPLVRIIIVFVVGIIIGESLKNVIPQNIWLAAVTVGLIFAILLRRNILLQGAMILLITLAYGGFMICHTENSVRKDFPKTEFEYYAIVASEPVVRGKVIQADIIVLDGKNYIKVKTSILRDTVENRYKDLHVGDGILAYSRLEPPKNFGNATFDYARYLTIHGYEAQTFIYYCNWMKSDVNLKCLPPIEYLKVLARKIRKNLSDRFLQCGLHGHEYAITIAMTLGDKSLINKDIRQDYSISGASHILALSGLHLSIVYAMLSFLFMRFRKHFLAQLLILTAIWSYVFLVGLTPSVVRSAIMLTIYSIVKLIGRERISLNTLALAALVMLISDPFTLYDIGFQLSFMAVLAILTTVPMIYSFIPKKILGRYRIVDWIVGIMVVSLAAQLGTAPLVAHYFGQLPTYFLITNIVAIPLATAILYSVIAFFLLMSFPLGQIYIAKGIAWLSEAMNTSLQQIASLPYASVDGIHLSAIQVFMIYVFMFCLFTIMAYMRRDVLRKTLLEI